MINIPIRVDDEKLMPSRAHSSDAGLDLRAGKTVVIPVGAARIIPTGVRVNIPAGYVGYVHIRSGLSLKHGLQLINSTGVIDAGYTGEIKAKVINKGNAPIRVQHGDRFCQMVVHELPALKFTRVSDLGDTGRGDGGFGSSGTK